MTNRNSTQINNPNFLMKNEISWYKTDNHLLAWQQIKCRNTNISVINIYKYAIEHTDIDNPLIILYYYHFINTDQWLILK